MKRLQLLAGPEALRPACLVLQLAASSAMAQPFVNFNCGSTGTVDLVVAANTSTNILLPPDGVLHYNSVLINSGATVTFAPNALNTPVYLLARSNVVIHGTVDVSGKNAAGAAPAPGGPGGFAGGSGAYAQGLQSVVGDGKGPGGGRGWVNDCCGGCDDPGAPGTFYYGNALCLPLIGGSGGAGGPISGATRGGGGGGGGGAILIAANVSVMIHGTIQALGGNGARPECNPGGSGSGGAIRIIAPLVSGNGWLSVSGGLVAFSRGGPGRIRIDSANPSLAQALNTWPATAVSVTRGSQDIVFPEDNRLTITNVIVSSTNYAILPDTPATISLPAGSNVVATVAIAARGRFYGLSTVPLAVVVAPENGASSNYNAVINLAGERGGANVTVTIPAGTSSTLHVWTHNN